MKKQILTTSIAALFLASCGGATSTSPTVTLPANATVIKAVPTLRFSAESYGPVPAGDVLLGYSNSDSVRHTLIISKDGVKVPNFKLVVAQKGASDSGTVTLEKGVYTVLCDIPGHSNMKATLTVE
jgi:plastocyanin